MTTPFRLLVVTALWVAPGVGVKASEWKLALKTDIGDAAALTDGDGVHIAAFLDATHGYAIFHHGEVHSTADGGKRWPKGRWAGGFYWPDGMDILNAKTAWISGGNYIRRTGDGGRTWDDLADCCTAYSPGRHVSFANVMVGWVATANNLRTTGDGGKNWKTVPLPRDANDDIMAVQRLPDAGFVLLNSGKLLKTTTGGMSWEVKQLPLKGRMPVPMIPSTSVEAIGFKDLLHGVAVLYAVKPERGFFIYETDDGGSTWRDAPGPAEVKSILGNIYLTRDGQFLTVSDMDRSRVYVYRRQ
jgi:photosystem II stability/assembly factor-like uncharacterized protein